MVFGDRVFIGRGTEFNIRDRLQVGDDCLIASGCTFIDGDHGRVPGVPMNAQAPVTAPIVLERNVWIGAQCVILKGVTIGEGSVVGAGSVVTKSVPPGETWAGVPAKRLPNTSEALS
jgi:acetyltransferase-like isoleucine patch superfamily enzyme